MSEEGDWNLLNHMSTNPPDITYEEAKHAYDIARGLYRRRWMGEEKQAKYGTSDSLTLLWRAAVGRGVITPGKNM